jgi:hypothetical protein
MRRVLENKLEIDLSVIQVSYCPIKVQFTVFLFFVRHRGDFDIATVQQVLGFIGVGN